MNIVALVLLSVPFAGMAAAVQMGAHAWLAALGGYVVLVFLLRCFASNGGVPEA